MFDSVFLHVQLENDLREIKTWFLSLDLFWNVFRKKKTNYMYKNPSIEKSILNTEKQYHSEISQHYTQSAALDAI